MAEEEQKPSGPHRAWWVVGATALAGVIALKNPKVRRLLTVNDVETGLTPEYPDIQPQTFPDPLETVFDAAVRVCEDLGWKVVAEDRVDQHIHAEVPVPPAFVDDFDISFTESEDGVTVHARSRGGLGQSDFGMNARHIRLFQRALDRMV